EESPRNNAAFHSYYDISKYGSEMEVWRASQEGLSVVIVNPGIIIGPGKWNSGSGQLFRLVAKGFPFRVPRKGGFVGVEDVVDAMLKLMNSSEENQRFIVVSENVKMEMVTAQIAHFLKCRAPKYDLKKWMVRLLWLGQSIGHVFGGSKQITRESIREIFRDVSFDNSKIQKRIGFEFTPIREALQKTAARYIEEH